MDDGLVVVRRVIARVANHIRQLTRADRWITLISTGFILLAPPAAWTVRHYASPPPATPSPPPATPSIKPAAPAASFVIEPIIGPSSGRPKRSSPTTAARATKHAPSKRQWIASLSRPTSRGR